MLLLTCAASQTPLRSFLHWLHPCQNNKNGLPVTLHSPVCSKMFADEKRAVTCTKTRRVNAFTNMEVRHIFGIVKKYAILLNSCFLSLSRNESASSIYTFSKKLGKRIRTVVVSVLTGYELKRDSGRRQPGRLDMRVGLSAFVALAALAIVAGWMLTRALIGSSGMVSNRNAVDSARTSTSSFASYEEKLPSSLIAAEVVVHKKPHPGKHSADVSRGRAHCYRVERLGVHASIQHQHARRRQH